MTLAQVLLFVPAAFLVAASPGANNLLSFTHGIKAGFGRTVVSLFGRFVAFFLMIATVALGLGGILAASETAFEIIKWIGVGYLAYVGWKTWRSPTLEPRDGPRRISAFDLARREFLVALTNPKAMLLFAAFLPQFVVGSELFSAQILQLGALYILIEFTAACGFAFAGSAVRRIEMTPKHVRVLNRVTGA